VRVVEDEFGTVTENSPTQRSGGSGCCAAAIVHGMTTGDRHILELDSHVRPNDVEHAIRHGLLDRCATSSPHEDVSLESGRAAADVEFATTGAGQRISCT
jgi:hypothetical protein